MALATPTSVPATDQPSTDVPVTDHSTTATPIATTAPTALNVRGGANVNTVADVGAPIRVIVASAGIDGPVSAAGVLDDNTVAVPPDPSIAGWFTGGLRPGELGPAVIVGHVDSKKTGPGSSTGCAMCVSAT